MAKRGNRVRENLPSDTNRYGSLSMFLHKVSDLYNSSEFQALCFYDIN